LTPKRILRIGIKSILRIGVAEHAIVYVEIFKNYVIEHIQSAKACPFLGLAVFWTSADTRRLKKSLSERGFRRLKLEIKQPARAALAGRRIGRALAIKLGRA
jgi:hypothetical protein